MRSIRNAICCLSLTFLSCTEAFAQDSDANDVRSEVVVIVSKALGGFDDNRPSYWSKLESERLAIDKGLYCSAQATLSFLSTPLVTEIVQTLTPALSKTTIYPAVFERPSYVEDLMVTAIVSFEYGRALSRRSTRKAEICDQPTPAAPAASQTETPSGPAQE